MLTYKKVPYNTFDPIYKYTKYNFHGSSFLLHPEELLYWTFKYSYKDLAIYIAMASLRPWAEYKLNKTVTLPLTLAPMHPHEYLQNTRLLPIRDEQIVFPYEESQPSGVI